MAFINGKEILFSAIINIGSVTEPDAPEIVKLSTPDVTISNTGYASWQAIENAQEYRYECYKGSIFINEGTISASYSEPFVQIANGVSIKVMAVGDGAKYDDSDWSTEKTYTAPVDPTRMPIYYGVGVVEGEAITSAFIETLTSKNQTSRVCSFTVSPVTQYIYFSAPRGYCVNSSGNDVTVFTVNNFSGGFLAPLSLTINNTEYYVYRSKRKLTGDVPVNVT